MGKDYSRGGMRSSSLGDRAGQHRCTVWALKDLP
jgi:hypothetical protein